MAQTPLLQIPIKGLLQKGSGDQTKKGVEISTMDEGPVLATQDS